MKIEPEDLPLIVAQMTVIELKLQEQSNLLGQIQRMREALNAFVRKHYDVDISDGRWNLDPETGELTNERSDHR